MREPGRVNPRYTKRFAARLLRAAVHGYTTLELNSAWQTTLDDDATFDWLLNVILGGLTSGTDPVF